MTNKEIISKVHRRYSSFKALAEYETDYWVLERYWGLVRKNTRRYLRRIDMKKSSWDSRRCHLVKYYLRLIDTAMLNGEMRDVYGMADSLCYNIERVMSEQN